MLKRNFTRKDLSNKIHQSIGFSKNISSKIVDDFFEIIISNLIKANKVKITSLGTFKIVKKKERMGRNPKTKIETKIASRNVVKFIPSAIFKKKLNKNER